VRIGIAAGLGAGRRGGVETYARELVSALVRHSSRPEHEVVRVERPAGADGAALRARRALYAFTGWAPGPDAVARQVDALGLDVVHYPATELPEFKLRTPAVLTFFDMQEEFLPAFFTWRARRARAAAHRAAVGKAEQVVVPSRFTGECLRARYGTPAAKIHHVPVGVADAFAPAGEADEGGRVRARYGIPFQDFVLYPANPWAHKNHERLFAALRGLHQDGLSMPIVCTGRLAGEGRDVAALARSAGLPPDLLRDAGFVAADDMPALYRAARALVFPSLFEGFGMPVLEAMACGCPVACARIPALLEVGGQAVRTFDPLSVGEMAAALREVWQDQPLRERLRPDGQRRAAEYRWPRVVPDLLRVYALAARRTEA